MRAGGLTKQGRGHTNGKSRTMAQLHWKLFFYGNIFLGNIVPSHLSWVTNPAVLYTGMEKGGMHKGRMGWSPLALVSVRRCRSGRREVCTCPRKEGDSLWGDRVGGKTDSAGNQALNQESTDRTLLGGTQKCRFQASDSAAREDEH